MRLQGVQKRIQRVAAGHDDAACRVCGQPVRASAASAATGSGWRPRCAGVVCTCYPSAPAPVRPGAPACVPPDAASRTAPARPRLPLLYALRQSRRQRPRHPRRTHQQGWFFPALCALCAARTIAARSASSWASHTTMLPPRGVGRATPRSCAARACLSSEMPFSHCTRRRVCRASSVGTWLSCTGACGSAAAAVCCDRHAPTSSTPSTSVRPCGGIRRADHGQGQVACIQHCVDFGPQRPAQRRVDLLVHDLEPGGCSRSVAARTVLVRLGRPRGHGWPYLQSRPRPRVDALRRPVGAQRARAQPRCGKLHACICGPGQVIGNDCICRRLLTMAAQRRCGSLTAAGSQSVNVLPWP